MNQFSGFLLAIGTLMIMFQNWFWAVFLIVLAVIIMLRYKPAAPKKELDSKK
ncbi:MAG: hypothetical protein LBS33_09100 [Streptococcaceae bacterium]|jgi:hypothetical protein|nr:hypothetical protein [Streptococcaceae bacterium]